MDVLSLLQKKTYSLVFDIGSATVGVAIARYSKGKPIHILFTHRELIQYGETQGATALGNYLADTIEKAGSKALEALGTLGDRDISYSLYAFAHAPWAHTRAQHVEGNLQSEVPITKELLQQFMAKKMPVSKVQGRTQLERHITKITLNGYPTLDPYGKKATHIAITALESDVSDVVHNSISNAFQNVFPNHRVSLDSFLFAATHLREFFEKSDTYTMMDISGEYTSLSIIRDDTIAASTWAGFGTEYLIRSLLTGEKTDRQSVVSELAMYIDNTCTPSQCRKIETALVSTEQEWVKAFGDACATLSKHSRIPTRVYISVDTRYGKWFKTVIEKIDFAHFTITGKPLQAHILNLDRTQKPIKYKEGVKQDTVLALGVLFVDK
ncbi:hypothetical protein JXR01_01025 [Candidatus Kaiserbacteria bacterium]|nr:MAG: hypothetical protein JXR01_01025 [Candidatus Kaiserbacteria bacterium]